MTKLPNAIIFDIDGVVADSRVRSAKYIDYRAEAMGDKERLIESLQEWGRTTEGDLLIDEGAKILMGLYWAFDSPHLLALTSRGERARIHTLPWLQQHLNPLPINSEQLYMRPIELETVPSPVYKDMVLEKILNEYNVLVAIDDHAGNCDAYYKRNIPTIHLRLPHCDCISVPHNARYHPRQAIISEQEYERIT